jgi:hypothetical protein
MRSLARRVNLKVPTLRLRFEKNFVSGPSLEINALDEAIEF